MPISRPISCLFPNNFSTMYSGLRTKFVASVSPCTLLHFISCLFPNKFSTLYWVLQTNSLLYNVCFQFYSNYITMKLCCHATNLMMCIHKVYFVITLFYRGTLTHIVHYPSAAASSRNDPSYRLSPSSVAWWFSIENIM